MSRFPSPGRFASLLVVGVFAFACSACGRDVDTSNRADRVTTLPASATTVPSTEVVPDAGVDRPYSDGPKCNALVQRIADEVVPCLQQIRPEYAENLQTTLDGSRPFPLGRARSQAEHDEQVVALDAQCQEHWQQMLKQVDSKSPEAQCVRDFIQ